MRTFVFLLCSVILAITANAKLFSDSEEKLDFLIQHVQQLQFREISHQNEIKELKTRMASMETSFIQKTSRMMNEIAQCKNNVSDVIGSTENRRALAQTQIAFYAIASPHYVENIRTGHPIMFDTVFTNLGNSYQPTTGTFTAPIGGTYAFSVNLSGRQNSGQTSYFTVKVNQVLRGKLLSHTLQQDSQFLILILRAGDIVYTTTEADYNGLLGQFYSTFSGFLLYE